MCFYNKNKYRARAYDIRFMEEYKEKDNTVILDIPAYALLKNYSVGDIITIKDMCGESSFHRRMIKRMHGSFEKYRIINIDYIKFSRWKFWNKDKYVATYFIEKL